MKCYILACQIYVKVLCKIWSQIHFEFKAVLHIVFYRKYKYIGTITLFNSEILHFWNLINEKIWKIVPKRKGMCGVCTNDLIINRNSYCYSRSNLSSTIPNKLLRVYSTLTSYCKPVISTWQDSTPQTVPLYAILMMKTVGQICTLVSPPKSQQVS